MNRTEQHTAKFNWRVEDFGALVESCKRDEATPYLLRYLPREGVVLDAGCGLGRFVLFLRSQGYSVTGIDVNPLTVAKARQVAPELDIRVGDVCALDFPETFFDGVFSLGVVEHLVAGPYKPLTEFFRVLKPGGILVVTVPAFNFIRWVKYGTARFLAALDPVARLKRWNFLRRLFGRKPLARSTLLSHPRLRSTPFRHRHHYDLGSFYQYLFGPHEFAQLLRQVGFEVMVTAPVARIDGLYHDVCRRWVRFDNWRFYPSRVASVLNSVLSLIPFFHNHMNLYVGRRPSSAGKTR